MINTKKRKNKDCEIIAVALQKGGSGKTTTDVNLATLLAEVGYKVLAVDGDPQGNTCLGFGLIPEDYIDKSILEVLTGDITIEECIVNTEYGVDVLPSNDFYAGLTIMVMKEKNRDKYPEPLMLLKKHLDKIKHNYDYIFIDLPPELGFFTINGLNACDSVIIPMQCAARAARGVYTLLTTISNVKKEYNPNIKIRGVVATMFNRNTNASTTVLEEVRKNLNGKVKVYDTVIYRTVKFDEADIFNQPAVTYTNNEQVQNYRNLAKEVFNIG